MSDSNDTNDLSEEEQTAVAVEWYLAMWNEALARGVAPETMALVALSATASKLSETFGAEHASLLIKQTADNAGEGGFDTAPEAEDGSDAQ